MKRLILIAGPSGSGKTTISKYLSDKYGIKRVLTHTTRPMRQGEQDGVDYYFETEDTFQKLHFFEHVQYGAAQYGSSREGLERAFASDDLVTLIVDTAGVKSYLQELGEQVTFIYLAAPSEEILRARLLKRGDTPAEIEKRLNSPEQIRDLSLPADLQAQAQIITNENLIDTYRKLDQIIAQIKEEA